MTRCCASEAELVDLHPPAADLRQEVLAGLSQEQKRLPCKLFYDQRGSELYEEITRLEEYYPTRTEIAIMRSNIEEIACLLGPRALVIEYGSGSSEKTRILLDHLEHPAGYVPVDISKDHLIGAAEALRREYPELEIRPVCADYTMAIDLPEVEGPTRRRVVYFPGSTIGNFEHHEAIAFLRNLAAFCQPGDALLLGVDLKKDPAVLEAAYNDSAGVTAEFNLNMLRRINAEIGADFALDRFEHRAFYNAEKGRIEMHLASTVKQGVNVDGARIELAAGETIWTESSYKYDLEEIGELAAEAGLQLERVWTDPAELFSVDYLAIE